MPHSSNPVFDLREVKELAGPGAMERGLNYAFNGNVISLEWDPGEHVLYSEVSGSDLHPYECMIDVTSRMGAGNRPVYSLSAGVCSCPVRMNCKHVVATVVVSSGGGIQPGKENPLTRGDPFARSTAVTVHDPPADSWKKTLLGSRQLDGEDNYVGTSPLALGFELRTRVRTGWMHEAIGELASAADVIRGEPLYLGIRPLMRGARNNWIKGTINWNETRFARRRIDIRKDHLEWFAQLAALCEASTPGGMSVSGSYELSQLNTTLLWSLLDDATNLGIELTGVNKLMQITRGQVATAALDLRRTGRGLELSAVTRIDAADLTGGMSGPIGRHGLYHVDANAGIVQLSLARLAQPLGPELHGVLSHGGPLGIPAAEEHEFITRFLPELQSRTELGSSDGSFEPPQISAPTLILNVRYGKNNKLTMSWNWHYLKPARDYALEAGPSEFRNHAAEDEVLAAVRNFWPEAATEDKQILQDLATAMFVSQVLPQLADVPRLKIKEHGERPDFRELQGVPHITITPVSAEKNDWLELNFEITIDGVVIPFVHIFTALAKGQAKVLLVDKSYFSLEHPVFDQLRDLIVEAEKLNEWNPAHPQLSRYRPDMWEVVLDIADEVAETEQALRWQRSVSQLLGNEPLSDVDVPTRLHADLRPYQHEGFQWLSFLYRAQLGGILADDMGLGKTVQTLALIAYAKEARGAAGVGQAIAARETDGVGQASRRGKAKAAGTGRARAELAASGADPEAAPFLVVAPTSVIGNWLAEVQKFAPHLDVRAITATARKRGTFLATEVAGADIVLTSYTLLRLDQDEFSDLPWAGLILDEAQFVKNPKAFVHQAAAKITTNFRLAITGTPLENSLGELWALTSLVTPGLFPSAHHFDQHYTKIIEKDHSSPRLAELKRAFRPFMMRRTKDQVAAELPPKQEQVLHIELSPRHMRAYDLMLQRERKKLLGLVKDLDKNRFIIFRTLTLLRMMALDPALVDKELAGTPVAKIDTLMTKLSELVADGHRALIFSQFTGFLKTVRSRLRRDGIEHCYLDGSTRNRSAVIEQFRTGSQPVFLISLKAGGFGLNLTEADYVFLLDPWWNPAAENQAIDRTHRIGQHKNVMVYRLVAQHTIEERVLALQQRKAELFSSVMDDGKGFSTHMSAQDIRDLLS